MEIRNLNYAHDDNVIFQDFSVHIPDGKITCILGSSGVGKTTLLQLVAGILKPQGESITTGTNKFSYLFQEPRLLPWKTVQENVEFVLLDQMDKEKRSKLAQEMLEQVGLKEVLDAFPHELSGGMRQRVAIARAFVKHPDILLLDEPLQGLDPVKRQEIQQLLISLWEKQRPTVLYITHDLEDALDVGHQILLFTGRPVRVSYQKMIDIDITDRIQQRDYIDCIRTDMMIQMNIANIQTGGGKQAPDIKEFIQKMLNNNPQLAQVMMKNMNPEMLEFLK